MTTNQPNRTLLPRTSRIASTQSRNLHDQELKQKEMISEQLKQKYIDDLEQRNRKLKNQIMKITQILEQNEQKQAEKVKQNLKNLGKNYKSNIGRSAQDNNPDLLRKQLQNVYKMIKNYERQIQKVENYRVGSKNSADEISRLQTIKYEKLQHLYKLNTELSNLQNAQALNSKKLKNNMGREYYENLILKVGDQLKVLRLKLRGLEEKEKKKVGNAKKQLEFIKKLQNQLLQEGVAMDQIQQLKRKNIYNQIKAAMNRDKEAEKSEAHEEPINGQVDDTEEQVVTYEKLEEMKNEIKLYKKLHLDYDKRLLAIQKQKESADKVIGQKKKVLENHNSEIQKLNQEIEEVKHLVRKNQSISNGTIAGQVDSIRKLQRKKSIEASQSRSNEKQDKNKSKPTSQRNTKN